MDLSDLLLLLIEACDWQKGLEGWYKQESDFFSSSSRSRTLYTTALHS